MRREGKLARRNWSRGRFNPFGMGERNGAAGAADVGRGRGTDVVEAEAVVVAVVDIGSVAAGVTVGGIGALAWSCDVTSVKPGVVTAVWKVVGGAT